MKFIVRHRETGLYYKGADEGFTRCMDLAHVFDDEKDKLLFDTCKFLPEIMEIIPTENE